MIEQLPGVTAISNFPEREVLSPASPSASVFTIRLTQPRHAWGAKLMEPINESDAAKHAASSNQWEESALVFLRFVTETGRMRGSLSAAEDRWQSGSPRSGCTTPAWVEDKGKSAWGARHHQELWFYLIIKIIVMLIVGFWRYLPRTTNQNSNWSWIFILILLIMNIYIINNTYIWYSTLNLGWKLTIF